MPRLHRRWQTLEFACAEVLALEQAADLPAGGGVDNYLTRPGEALKAGCKVWRVSDCCLLTRVAGADGLADNHQSRRDANADL